MTANGFFQTFISLRAALEDFDATLAGLVLGSYFAGFTVGAVRCGRIIERIGHIRAYAAFAGLFVAAKLLHVEGHPHMRWSGGSK
jgi:MFS family permease